MFLKGNTTVNTKTEFLISNNEVGIEDFDISKCFSTKNSNIYAVKFDDIDEKDFNVEKINIKAFQGKYFDKKMLKTSLLTSCINVNKHDIYKKKLNLNISK